MKCFQCSNPQCGKKFNSFYNSTICDECGGELVPFQIEEASDMEDLSDTSHPKDARISHVLSDGKEKKKKHKKRVIITVGCIALLLIGVICVHCFVKDNKTEIPENTSTTKTINNTENTTTETEKLLGQGICSKDGENIRWKISDDGVLFIYGKGETADYESNKDVPWYSIIDNIRFIKVEEGIVSLGSRLFAGCSKVENIELPESLNRIGMFSFQLCQSLTAIYIPSSVEDINPYAFDTCKGLASFEVSVQNSHYKDIDGFLYSKDEKVLCHVPSTYYGGFVVPEGVETILSDAFCCVHLTSLVLPASLKCIERFAFDECNGLSTITVAEGNDTFCSKGNVLFSSDMKTLCLFPMSFPKDEYIIPDSVEVIADTAFCNTNLKRIVFPESIKELNYRIITQAQSDVTLVFYGNAPSMKSLPTNSRHAVYIDYPKDAYGWDSIIALDKNNSITWTAIQ